LLYLNDGFLGGHTHFAELDLTVAPAAGAALVWYNCDLPYKGGDMVPDARLTHAGMPAGGGLGELKKYAANKWAHAAPLRIRSD
jgi:prolyl 4-hydroxylase